MRLLANLGALQCIHPTLDLDKNLWRQLLLLERCLRGSRGEGENYELQISPWLLRLEVIIAHLIPEYRGKVAENLQLGDDSIKRLYNLDSSYTQVIKLLPNCQMPSLVVQVLRQYDLPMLILIALQSPRSIRSQIWRHLTVWANVQSPLNGNDLKRLGYKPGPLYKQILEHLLAAKLDGIISDRPEAEQFLAKNYPNNRG